MKPLPILFFWTLLFLSGNAFGQDWKKILTVEHVYGLYPGRIDSLLQSLDLDREGLQKVKEAVAKGDPVSACKELLNYYRTREATHFLRREHPAPSSTTDPAADSIVRRIFTFYEVSDNVPQIQNGQLDWTYHGPANDIEWAWGLNRHFHIQSLLDSYFKTGNPLYAKTIDQDLRDWVMSSLPYPRKKSSTELWRGLEVSFRVKVWARVFFGLMSIGHLSPATAILLLSSLPEHTHYLEHFHAKAGNWLTMEMSGLAMVSTAWPEFKRSREWIAYAKNNMLEGLKDQVYPDGVQKELTSHYHQVALNNFDLFEEICEQAQEPLPGDYKKVLEKMHSYIAYSVRPNGYGVVNNDSDNRYNRDLITEAASEYSREDWLFIASNGKKGKRPSGPPSVVFPWAGQLIMRSGYDPEAHWAFFDAGPWGTGHQHSDKLHLSISAYGRDLLVDAGRFAYRGAMAEKFRRYATGSASHNVVLIDGAGQDAGPLVATEPLSEEHYRITDQFDYAWSTFDKFRDLQGEGKHTRSVFYVRGKFWIVVDNIQTDRPRKIETLWHWHPDSKLRIDQNAVVSTDHEKGNLKIIPVGFDGWRIQQVEGQADPTPQGWYSERYNKAEPAPVSIYATEIETSTSFVWVLFPSAGKGPAVTPEIISRESDGLTVRVKDEESNQWEVSVPFSSSAGAHYTFRSYVGKQIQRN